MAFLGRSAAVVPHPSYIGSLEVSDDPREVLACMTHDLTSQVWHLNLERIAFEGRLP